MRLLRSMDSVLKWSNREGNQICKIPDIWWCGHLVMKQTAYQDHIEIKLLIKQKICYARESEGNKEWDNKLSWNHRFYMRIFFSSFINDPKEMPSENKSQL